MSCAPFLLLVFFLASPTFSAHHHHGKLYIQFISYSNPTSKDIHGHYCDGFKIFGWMKKNSACDPKISLCVGAKNKGQCHLANIKLPTYRNRDVVHFGSRIGGKPNPYVIPFHSLPHVLTFYSVVYDHDRIGNSDLMDKMRGIARHITTRPTYVHVKRRTDLVLRVWYKCVAPYTGARCSRRNFCSGNKCSHHTRFCVSGSSKYRCVCKKGWTGRYCHKRKAVDNPCKGHKKRSYKECRVQFTPRMAIVAIVHEITPVRHGSVCKTVEHQKKVTGAAAQRLCRH